MIHWNVTGLKNGRNIPQLTQSVQFIFIYNFSLVFMDFNVDEVFISFSFPFLIIFRKKETKRQFKDEPYFFILMKLKKINCSLYWFSYICI